MLTRRLPLVLALVALAVALSGVNLADAASTVRRALFATNAGKVNGIQASRTPQAGKLLALDRNRRLPASVIPRSVARGPRGAQGPPGPAGAASALANPYVFRARKVAAQDTQALASSKVLLGAEDFDPSGSFDPGASRFTAPVSGYYQFSGSVAECCAGGRLFASLVTNRASMTTRGTDDVVGVSTINRSVVTGLMQLQAGDTVELTVYTSAAGTLPVEDGQTFLSGHLVATG